MHAVAKLCLKYFVIKIVSSYQNPSFDAGLFSAIKLDVIPDSYIFHNATTALEAGYGRTTEMGCARLCHEMSLSGTDYNIMAQEHCTGFLYMRAKCLLVAGNYQSWARNLVDFVLTDEGGVM